MNHPARRLRRNPAPRLRRNPAPRLKRILFPLLAGGLTALVLPWSSAGAEEVPAFSGFTMSAWAAPVKIEVYEPTIPIPATPQFEVELGYSRAEAETGISRGRGSWIWPGDPVGEGAKTFAEALGLPEQVGEAGYPVQVNSVWPTGPEEQADEPFPGMVMRTAASQEKVSAAVGWSPDGEAQDPQDAGDDGDGGDAPGLPEVPGLPSGSLQDFGDAITGAAPDRAAAADDPGEDPAPDDGAPGVPPEVAALVDFTGYTSRSEATTGTDEVATYARSSVTDVVLLGGVVTIEGVRARTVTSSDGDRAAAEGHSALGTMTIGGNEFTIGPDGIEAQGQQQPIPGLPDEPEAALEQLGLQFAIPKPQLDKSGDNAQSLVQGLQVTLDTTQLRQQLADLPLNEIIGQVPDEAGELKKALQAAVNLSPKFVITLGNAGTATDTVLPLTPPTVPTDPGDAGEDTTGGAEGGGGGGPAAPAGGAAPGAPADAAPTGEATGDLTGTQPMGNGLPPLNSIPGALTVGGIVLASAAGSWLRKIGAIALGGAGSCPHGLDSGLPDLRKA